MMTAYDFAQLQSYFAYVGKTAAIIAGGPTVLTGPDPTRWGMYFSQSDTVTWRAWPVGTGFNQSPFRMAGGASQGENFCTFPTHGALPQQQWFGQCQTSTGTVGWIEVYYRPPAGGLSMADLLDATS